MTAAPSARRDRRRAKVRSDLLDAARLLIASRGLAELRVSDVVEQADVALGTFYSHFASKEEMVEAIVADAITALAVKVADLGPHLDPAHALSIGVRRLVGLAETDPDLARLMLRLDSAERVLESLVWEQAVAIMQRGAESGRFETGDVHLTLRIAVAGVFVTIESALASEQPNAAEECATVLLQAVGITREEAQAIAQLPLPADDSRAPQP